MTFEKDYTIILSQAKLAIRENQIDLEPEELISNIYIKLFSSPDYTYDYFSFQKEITVSCKYFDQHNVDFIPYNDRYKKSKQHINFRGQKVCRTCHEIKSTQEFQIKINKVGKKCQRAMCNLCYSNYKKDYDRKNKERNAAQKRNRRIAHPEIVKASEKRKNKRRSVILSDSYIKMLLWPNYSKEYIKDNPEIIELTRQRVIKKRRKKIVKKVNDFRERRKPVILKEKKGRPVKTITKKIKFDYSSLYKDIPKEEKINPIAFSNYKKFCSVINEKIKEINSEWLGSLQGIF